MKRNNTIFLLYYVCFHLQKPAAHAGSTFLTEFFWWRRASSSVTACETSHLPAPSSTGNVEKGKDVPRVGEHTN